MRCGMIECREWEERGGIRWNEEWGNLGWMHKTKSVDGG